MYGIDTRDPSLYDLVIHLKRITVEDTVELIMDTVQLPQFQTTPASQKALEDLALAAEVKAVLAQVKCDIEVMALKRDCLYPYEGWTIRRRPP